MALEGRQDGLGLAEDGAGGLAGAGQAAEQAGGVGHPRAGQSISEPPFTSTMAPVM